MPCGVQFGLHFALFRCTRETADNAAEYIVLLIRLDRVLSNGHRLQSGGNHMYHVPVLYLPHASCGVSGYVIRRQNILVLEQLPLKDQSLRL